MGLFRAVIITLVCYFAVERLWQDPRNPLPKKKKTQYEKPIILAIIFLIELLF